MNSGARQKPQSGLKPKDRCMIPARVALALQADGWWIRQECVWAKPNPMPESCTDRPTTAHEMVYLLTKSQRYFYDAEAVQEPFEDERRGNPGKYNAGLATAAEQTRGKHGKGVTGQGWTGGETASGRNRRSWWKIATQSYKEAHFATFPEKLVEPCVLAGTSEKGCCPQCGAPWERVVEKSGGTIGKDWGGDAPRGTRLAEGAQRGGTERAQAMQDGSYKRTTTGWRPGCGCSYEGTIGILHTNPPLDPVPCTVLDPFCGSGTTLLVACQHGREAIGIELSPEYAALAERRIGRGLRPGTYVDEQDSSHHPLFT